MEYGVRVPLSQAGSCYVYSEMGRLVACYATPFGMATVGATACKELDAGEGGIVPTLCHVMTDELVGIYLRWR